MIFGKKKELTESEDTEYNGLHHFTQGHSSRGNKRLIGVQCNGKSAGKYKKRRADNCISG